MRRPDTPEEDVLLALRIGLNVTDLRHSREILGSDVDARIDDALFQLRNLGPDRRGSREVSEQGLSTGLARLTSALGRLPPSAETIKGMGAAIGLRLDLDPRFGGGEATP
jgi:hypothetical protein